MKLNLLIFFAISLTHIHCSTNDTNSKEQNKDTQAVANTPIPRNDIFKCPLIDTTLIFTNTKELNSYKTKFDKEFRTFEDSSKSLESFVLDSIYKINEDLYTVLAYKLTKNTKQDIYLLLYNLDFSNFITIEDRIQTFNSLPEQIKNSKEGKFVFEKLNQNYTRSEENIGFKLSGISSFQLLDSNNKKYFLSNLLSNDHKYTLLIFSASWCTPCKYEGRLIKRQFSSIDHSQIKIITVSIDKDIQKWKKSIKNDDYPWIQVWAPREFDSELTKGLNIKMIPANLLINDKQEVIAQNTDVTKIFTEFPNLFIK